MPAELTLLEEINRLHRRKFLYAPLKKYGMRRLCEVGVRSGANLRHLLNADPEVMAAVDIWKADENPDRNDSGVSQERLDRYYKEICSWKTKFPCLQVLRMYSVEAAQQFTDGYFDFVYIDADHSYDGISEDVAAWWPKIRLGGILSGHDYNDGYVSGSTVFAVKQVVDKFVAAEGLQNWFCLVPKPPAPGPSWFIMKPPLKT